jgi:hypothetical protein
MPELRVQPSFTDNDENSDCVGPAARFVIEPTQNQESFVTKFQRSSQTSAAPHHHCNLRSVGITGWRKSHLTFNMFNIECQATLAPAGILRPHYILKFTLRSSGT